MKRDYTVILEGEEYRVEIKTLENAYLVKMGNVTHRFEILLKSSTLYSLLIDETHVMEADVALHQDRCELYVRNVPYHLEVFDPRRRVISQSEFAGGNGLITAPMPGKIVELRVKPGEKVEKDQPLVVIEAMKMQNELNSPFGGVVQEISIRAGETVEADQKLAVVKKL
jgi:biotin carboxyl carrier protein